MNRLTINAQRIFQAVLDAMQNAEELGGPEGQDYAKLMEAIADEARTRLRNFHDIGLTCFDDYEIHEGPEEWTLYGHIPGEGLDVIGDFETQSQAEEVHTRITGRPYLHTTKEGSRFRLIREVNRFPEFVAPSGLVGTVTAVAGGQIIGRMDQPVLGAESWANELNWDSLSDFLADTEPFE
jgi:hypothetical protein